jgi:hypothetical protein
MSGALAVEDVATAARLKPPRARKRAAFSRIARDRDHDRAIDALKARRDAALAKEKVAKEGGQPGSEDEATAGHQRASGTALSSVRIPPAATTEEARPLLRRESSVLADFKLRPRKPSLLQMVQAQHQQPATEDSDDDDSLNDFQPEDESTPFMKPRSHPTNAHSTPSASAPSVLQTSSSRKRKFGSPEPEVQVPASQSSPSQPSSSPPPRLEPAKVDLFDIPADEDAREPSLPLIRSTQLSSPHAPSSPAPPTNSSPQPPPKSTRPPPTSLPKPRHLNKPPREISPPPSPLSTTSSHPSPIRSPQKPPPKPLTTASLQNLLPRRRVRPRDKEVSEFDLPSSSDVELSEDQDELSYHKAPKAKARKGAATPRVKAGKGGAKVGGAKVGGAKVGGGKVGSTYARKKATELPEDEGSDEEAGQGGEGGEGEGMKRKGGEVYGKSATAVKGEMRRLAQKFREVDDWALEIEDVTPHSGSSQMVDAR